MLVPSTLDNIRFHRYGNDDSRFILHWNFNINHNDDSDGKSMFIQCLLAVWEGYFSIAMFAPNNLLRAIYSRMAYGIYFRTSIDAFLLSERALINIHEILLTYNYYWTMFYTLEHLYDICPSITDNGFNFTFSNALTLPSPMRIYLITSNTL